VTKFLDLSKARKNKLKLDWANYTPKTLMELKLLKLIWMFWFPIDWTPFFRTWQLFGKYPAILNR
jgi:5-methyltetrahydrofolate--homocysteine methyltransferase